MNILKKEELISINGGSISYSLINAVTKALTSLYDFGRGVGSTLRRIRNNSYCPM